jgi:hypothetical protein
MYKNINLKWRNQSYGASSYFKLVLNIVKIMMKIIFIYTLIWGPSSKKPPYENISNYFMEPSWISSMSMKNGHSYMMVLTMMLAMILAMMFENYYEILIKRSIKHKD